MKVRNKICYRDLIYTLNFYKIKGSKLSTRFQFTEDFREVKTAPTECKEKCFQMMSPAHLHYSKAPKNVLMLLIHLGKRSGR